MANIRSSSPLQPAATDVAEASPHSDAPPPI
jgi:hypothetical protein